MNAFSEIVRALQSPLYGFVLRLTADAHVASELTQEAFLKALSALDSYRDGAPVKPWIFRIARNLTLDYLRRAEHRYRSDADPETTTSQHPSPHRAAVIGQAMQHLEDGLASLSPQSREALVLRLIDGMSYEDMAEVTGTSVSAIKARFLRARIALRQYLESRE